MKRLLRFFGRCDGRSPKADAQADLALLKKINGHLAKELEQFMQTGKEDDELYGATKKK